MQLWVVRHAIAISRDDPDCPPDPDRALTERGRRRMEEAAIGLRKLEVLPQRILTSPYLRARETAEIIAETLPFPVVVEETESLEPDQDPMVLLGELGRSRDAPTLVCGHAPHLDGLIARVVDAPREFTRLKKGGAVGLELPGGPLSPGILHWSLPPRSLRQLGTR